LLGTDQAALQGPAADALGVQSPAVVADLDVDLAALVEGAQGQLPRGRLARAGPLGGRLQPVVDGVADEVGQRVADRLEDRAVQLRVASLQADADLLAAHAGEIAHHAGEAVPDVADRLHARLHDALLQLTRDQV